MPTNEMLLLYAMFIKKINQFYLGLFVILLLIERDCCNLMVLYLLERKLNYNDYVNCK